ncbi:MAG: penicillin-binding protein 2 [Proteobacteria bacterium]|nr:penicillin-binding protein 2 [Pseudomonadota bacterium]
MRDEVWKLKTFTRRSFFIIWLKGVFFTMLGFRFAYLQIIESDKYKTLAESNRIRLTLTPQARGQITDRNDNFIATNRALFRLLVNNHDERSIHQTVAAINQYLRSPIKMDEDELAELIKKSDKYGPITLIHELTWPDIAAMESHRYKLPDFIIEQAFKREYPAREATAHLLGYIAPPTEEEVRKNSKQPGIFVHKDIPIGKNGVEKSLDSLLVGRPGIKRIEVDAHGKIVRELGQEPAINGDRIAISIDVELQKYIHELLAGRGGAAVVMHAITGEVLAMYSSPSYDPNLFIEGVTHEEWEKLTNNPNTPLMNKCISATYPPGSTFKMVTAIAAREAGIRSDYKVNCTGSYQVGSRTFHCWNRQGHGLVDMNTALAQSCNPYFYNVSEKIGIDEISKVAAILGLGQKTGIELPFESAGLIPNRSWKMKKYKQDWMRGDTVNASIGQGYVLATITQLTVMLARIISGQNITPTLRYGIQRTFDGLPLNAEHLEEVKDAIYAAFNRPYGKNYASRLDIEGFEISGKSGTTQVASLANSKKRGLIDHGFFLGFAPYQSPRYVVASIVEHGGWGSSSAMPIVRQIMQYLALKERS